MNSFESLLEDRMEVETRMSVSSKASSVPKKSLPQKANSSASLNDFIKMVDKLVTLTIPNAMFVPDEGKVYSLDPMTNFDKPIITYKIIERKAKGELKPRVRETVEEVDELNETRVGEVYGQKFKCFIQFNIFASVYKDAEEVMEKFEELITIYTGYFKKNGVAELLFEKHITDDFYAQLRETLSIRNLVYYVEVEKLTVIFKSKIKEIELLAQKKEEN